MSSTDDDGRDDLDLLSTSQTIQAVVKEFASQDAAQELAFQYEQKNALAAQPCQNNAPYIFYTDANKRAHICQGCCNSWTCPRCGHIRACHEYGRMVVGAKQLADAGHSLFFLTLTCQGKTLALAEANARYLEWTNRFLTNARAKCKRGGAFWSYCQVTERQARLHPHSHILTTFCPDDAIEYAAGALLEWRTPGGAITARAKHDGLESAWLTENVQNAGLGPMTTLSVVKSPVGAAVYAAKYFFKDAMTTQWPKNWRRVRHSHTWPKLPRYKSDLAFPLVRFADWLRMEQLGITVHADCQETLEAAYARRILCVKFTQKNTCALTHI